MVNSEVRMPDLFAFLICYTYDSGKSTSDSKDMGYPD